MTRLPKTIEDKAAAEICGESWYIEWRITGEIKDLQDKIFGETKDQKALEKSLRHEAVQDILMLINILSKYQKEQKHLQRFKNYSNELNGTITSAQLNSDIETRSNLISALHGIVDLLNGAYRSERFAKFPWDISFTLTTDDGLASFNSHREDEVTNFLKCFLYKRGDDKINYEENYLLRYAHMKMTVIKKAMRDGIRLLALYKLQDHLKQRKG